MRAILTIAMKDLRILARDKAGFFWVLGFPFLMALFFGSIIGGGGNQAPMDIAIIDQDQTPYSRAFVAELRKSEALRVTEAPIDSARQLVRQGRLVAYVALPAGVGNSLGFGGKGDNGIELGIDPSRRAEVGYLKGLVSQAIFVTLQSQWGSGQGGLGGGPNIRTVDVAEESSGPRSAFEVTFPSAVMWALIGVCMSFAISIVHERLAGTFLRLRLAPISRTQILAGKGLAAFLAAIAATTFLLAFAAVVFKVRITNPPGLAVALVAAAFCFVGLMMLISVLGRTHQAVAGAGWAILLVMSMTGGGMVPLIAMPEWMQSVSNFSLVKWGVLSVEGAIWRGFSWGEMMGPVAILVGIGAVAFSVGARALTRSET